MSDASYTFRLERVRALRERREDEAKAELGRTIAQHDRAHSLLQHAADRVVIAQAGHRQTGPMRGEDLRARQAFLERAEGAHRVAAEDLRRHETAVARARGVLTEAARDRQALEKLKARGLAEHRREVARREAIELGEMAIQTFRRRAAA